MNESRRSRNGVALTSLLVLVASGCGTDEEAPRPLGQEGAHEHGVARVGLTVEGAQATLTFRAPAAEVYGFEHTPVTDEDRARREEGLDTLESRLGEALVFDAALGCEVRIRERGWALGEGGGDPGHDHDGDHDGDHDHDHAADDHPDADHPDADHPDGHLDVEAVFDVRCEAPLAGSRLRLAFGDILPGIVDVDLQVVSDRTFGGRYRATGAGVEL